MPAVAVTVNCVVPTGVDGASVPDELEQPATRAMGIKAIAATEVSRLLLLLRRRKSASEPKGRSRASVMPAARVLWSRSRAITVLLVVWMVTTSVAGAEAVAAIVSWREAAGGGFGRPLQARVTVPLKLLVGATATIGGAGGSGGDGQRVRWMC